MMGMGRILVIDDDPKTLDLYREVLESAGHDATLAENGVVGLAQSDPTIDLTVVDLMMPNMNGYEFMKRCGRARTTRRPR